MPFPIQVLEPKYLSRDPLTTKLGDDKLEAVFNGTAANVIRQLSGLATVAQRIFLELNDQMKEIQTRTEKLRGKVANIDDIVSKLDAKQVPLPAGSLDDFSRLRTHYTSSKSVEKCLFTSDSRPVPIRNIYENAIPSPIRLVRTIDHYRKDGQRSSSLFLCMPFFKDVRVPYDVNIEMRRPASLSSAICRGYRSDGDDDLSGLDTTRDDDGERDLSVDVTLDSCDGEVDLDVTLLPTPDEKIYVDSLQFPHADVTVDVSGNGFRRMSSLRRSFIHQMEQFNSKRKKKKKRCAEPEKTSENTKKDQQVANKVNDGASTSGEGLKNHKKENKEVQTCFDEAKEKSIGFSRWFHRKPRSRNSIIGGIAIYEELDRVKKSKRRSIAGSLWIHSNNSSSSCSPSKSNTDSAVSTGASSVSDTNLVTLKSNGVKLRAHGKGHRVKREDGGQSSSGNWSASSSTRTSMESEDPIVTTASINENQLLLMTATATLPRCYGRDEKKRNLSQSSTRKESLTSERSLQRERGDGSSSGYLSDGPYYRASIGRRSLPPRLANSATVTARWLRSLEEEGGAALCSETTDATSSTGTITPRIYRRQRPISPIVFVDDGESSEFSVDTDGYYTSMHTDSGLRTQVNMQVTSRLSDLREHGSNSTLSSVSSGRTTSSSSSKKVTTSSEDTSNKDSCNEANVVASESEERPKKKTPPPPPPRASNIVRSSIVDSSTEDDSPPRKASIASDSDVEAGERLESKTKMNSERIPSLCVVTPNASDDEDVMIKNKTQTNNSEVENKSVEGKSEPWSRNDNLRSSYHSLPRIAQDKGWSRDDRAYRTLPRNYNRNSVSEIQQPSVDENHNKISLQNQVSTAQRFEAHVTLDPNGKVIHATNSLPRQLYTTNSLANLQNGKQQQMGNTDSNWSSANNRVPQIIPQKLNSADYSSNTFPRWRSNQTQENPYLANNIHGEATQRKWNNFGFLKRDLNQAPRLPIGAYVRMDGHPEHFEPGSLSKINIRQSPNIAANPNEHSNESSNEELSNNANVPTPPAAMPLIQNTNYGQASRLPTRTLAAINTSNVLPPYYSPVETRTSIVPAPMKALPPPGMRHATISNQNQKPIMNYKSSVPSSVSYNSPASIQSNVIKTQPRPPFIPTNCSTPMHRQNNYQIPLQVRPPVTTQNVASMRPGSAQRALFPSTTAPNHHLSPMARPLTINTGNHRPILPPNSPTHTNAPQRINLSVPQPIQNGTTSPVSQSKSMSTDELFAAIHQSKKKMNIKTDSISPTATTSSSRSNSPCLKSPTSDSKTNRPESGVLSPRTNSPPNLVKDIKAGDRRSWAMGDCSSPVNTPIENRSAGDRRSWASDRLGPSKPTSLHDFKRLLLQAGRGSSLSGADSSLGRKSAMEMLKTGSPTVRSLTPTNTNMNKSRLSSQSSGSSTIPGRSPSPKTLVNGHLSLSRSHNSRMRVNNSVLHNRTDILSTPIPEDEGSENEDEESHQSFTMPLRSLV